MWGEVGGRGVFKVIDVVLLSPPVDGSEEEEMEFGVFNCFIINIPLDNVLYGEYGDILGDIVNDIVLDGI